MKEWIESSINRMNEWMNEWTNESSSSINQSSIILIPSFWRDIISFYFRTTCRRYVRRPMGKVERAKREFQIEESLNRKSHCDSILGIVQYSYCTGERTALRILQSSSVVVWRWGRCSYSIIIPTTLYKTKQIRTEQNRTETTKTKRYCTVKIA